jgi:TPR repeat protein
VSRFALHRRIVAAVFAFSAIGVCSVATSAEKGEPAAAVAKTAHSAGAGAATLDEIVADPERVWARFLAEADLGKAYAHYDVLDAVGYTYATVDADRCREQDKTLREAVRALPVSIAIHRAAMLCADATGDAAVAESEATALAVLSRHALTSRGDAAWHRPVPVLSPRDIYALIALLGYEFRYEYYKSLHPRRYLPMVVAAWDPEARVERHIAFDFIDPTYHISRDDTYSGYPFQRHVLADAFVQMQSKGGEAVAVDMLAMQAAFTAASVDEGLGHLREGAAQGGIASLSNWMLRCVSDKTPHCEDGLIDALLPLAEKEYAAPMALLALAYAEGIGVKRDARSAETLLEAADKRWHARGASVMFAAMSNLIHPGDRNDFVTRRLGMAAEAGNAEAELMLVVAKLLPDGERALTAQEISVLERPSSNDVGLGYSVLAEHYGKRGMTEQMNAASRKAADHGYATAQRERALMAIREGGGKVARDVWWADMAAAAHGGDAYAMRYLSNEAANAKDWKGAAGWLLAAAASGDLLSLYAIADLYQTGEPGLPAGLDTAVKTYEALASDQGENGAQARRRLAALAMQGRGMKRNPKRAIEWLQVDAARGDAESQLQLATIHLRRDFEGADIAEGRRWIERAIAGGSSFAKSVYGQWLASRAGSTREDRARGLALLREAAAGDDPVARNNFAWALCVSAADDVRDPAAGLRIAKVMETDPALEPGDVDTVAACYAANGDFAAAVRLQQRAIDGLPRDDKGKPQGGQGIFDRLDLYRAGKTYLDTPQ